MKILKMPSYCFPEEVASSHLNNDLNEAFVKSGFVVENIAPTPSRGVSQEVRNKYKKIKYEELYEGQIIIRRFALFKEGKNTIQRAFRYVLCNVIQYWKGIHTKDVNVVYSGSTPPTQGVLCALVAKRLSKKYKRKVPFVYNLQDIFPDSLVNAKMTREGSVIWKIGRLIENYTYKNADKIIVISEDFKNNLLNKNVPEEKIVIIPNWVNTDNVYPVDRNDNILFDRYNLDRDKFYICYSGNIGLSQNMELLLDVAKQIEKDLPDLRFVLIGDGAAKEYVATRIQTENIKNVIMLPFQPYEDIAHVFSLGDVGLIISKPGIGTSSVPSKTWSIMAAERPVLASFDKNSELSKLIDSVSCGSTVDADEKDSLEKVILEMESNITNLRVQGKKGRQYILDNLSKEKCTKEYIIIFNEVTNI